jgi:hypothetical protein
MATYIGYYDNFLSLGIKGDLGDYQHAARLYVDNNMRLAPKFKHLYHVVMNINTETASVLGNVDRHALNVLCKSVDLPKYNISTSTLNQYNRKKVIQTNVDYQPVTLSFHDDNAGLTSLLWEAYFRYYYADSNYTRRSTTGTPEISAEAYKKDVALNPIYGSSDGVKFRYGLDRPNKKLDFFTSIQVFQLSPQGGKSTFTSFTLINPKISQFQHDTMAQEGSEFSTNSMTVDYEAVMYNRGYTVKGSAPTEFGTRFYDPTPSSLAGGAGTTTGISGITETGTALGNIIKQITGFTGISS